MKVRILTLCLAAGVLHAQVYTPPPAAGPAGTSPVPQDVAPAAQGSKPESVLGQEIPLLDPSAETITIGGVTIPLGDNRLMRARFEKFLSQKPESGEEAATYRATLAEILATLSPLRPGGPDLYSAFQLLPTASSYPGDAGLCSSLAESIYTAMLAKRDVEGLRKINEAMEKEKQAVINEGDWKARHERDKTLGNSEPAQGKEGGKRSESAVNPGSGVNSLKYAEVLRRIAEIEALKKANTVRTEAQTIASKTHYQVNMVQWFLQRRYEHVLMAARFYNQIWKDGDATLRIDKNSDVAKLFSESVGISPTVASLDALASEVIREAAKAVEAFELLLDTGELHGASQRLMEAFAVGEYLAPLATLETARKRRVLEHVRGLHELYGAVQARDYLKAREINDRLKASARDYPSSKVDSVIAAHTLASDFSLNEAKAHLLANRSDLAAEKIRSATEIWPTNPGLEELRRIAGGASVLATARTDFDRLISEGNFREILRRQYEIAPAIQGDAARESAFREVIGNLTVIETALGKAAEFARMGQHYAAWEQLAELRGRFPDDPKLGRELELLAPKVADLTKALDAARQLEERMPRQTGSALSWYLKARSIHPQSKFASEGIERLVGEILPAAP